jgi:hypothetical protein
VDDEKPCAGALGRKGIRGLGSIAKPPDACTRQGGRDGTADREMEAAHDESSRGDLAQKTQDVGVQRFLLEFHVDEEPVPGSRAPKDLGEAGDPGGQSASGKERQRFLAASDPAGAVVVDDEALVGGHTHVELDAMGADVPRGHDGFPGVFPRVPVEPSMGQDERSASTGAGRHP